MSLDSKPRRVCQWYRNHVYRMYDFRTLYDQEQATSDPQEKEKIRSKMRHPQEKAEQHVKYGISLRIPESQIRDFNLAIIDEIKKGKDPQRIIQKLIRENGQK